MQVEKERLVHAAGLKPGKNKREKGDIVEGIGCAQANLIKQAIKKGKVWGERIGKI